VGGLPDTATGRRQAPNTLGAGAGVGDALAGADAAPAGLAESAAKGVEGPQALRKSATTNTNRTTPILNGQRRDLDRRLDR